MKKRKLFCFSHSHVEIPNGHTFRLCFFWVKIRGRPDNLTCISQNNHLLHHFSVFFQKAANSGPLTSWAEFDLSWKDRRLLSCVFWFPPPRDFAVITVFSWRCCILKFYCSKLYFEILFSVHLSTLSTAFFDWVWIRIWTLLK